MIAVDSSVLIDLLGGDAGAEASETSLRQALAQGPVVVCDVVVAEVVAGLGFGSRAGRRPRGRRHPLPSPTEPRAAVRAGEMQRRYKQRLKAEGRARLSARTVPDFLIGAHALLQCSG